MEIGWEDVLLLPALECEQETPVSHEGLRLFNKRAAATVRQAMLKAIEDRRQATMFVVTKACFQKLAFIAETG